MNKKFEGKITASMQHTGEEDLISIKLVDKNISSQIIEIYLTPEQYGLMLGGLSRISCKYEVSKDNVNLVGLKREVKDEIIDISSIKGCFSNDFVEKYKKLVKPYEVDGWKCRPVKSYNHHDSSDYGNKYRFSFERYVEQNKESE